MQGGSISATDGEKRPLDDCIGGGYVYGCGWYWPRSASLGSGLIWTQWVRSRLGMSRHMRLWMMEDAVSAAAVLGLHLDPGRLIWAGWVVPGDLVHRLP